MVQAMLYAGHWSSATDVSEEAALAVGATAALTFTGATNCVVNAHLTTTAATAFPAYISVSGTFDTGARTSTSLGIAFINARISTDDPPAGLWTSHDSPFACDVATVRCYSTRSGS